MKGHNPPHKNEAGLVYLAVVNDDILQVHRRATGGGWSVIDDVCGPIVSDCVANSLASASDGEHIYLALVDKDKTHVHRFRFNILSDEWAADPEYHFAVPEHMQKCSGVFLCFHNLEIMVSTYNPH